MEYPVYTKETCPLCKYNELEYGDRLYKSSSWDGGIGFDYVEPIRFCPLCGKDLLEEETKMADAIDEPQQTTEQNPRWVPVTERLPNSGDKVIVAIRDESGDTTYDYIYSGWYSGYENKWIIDDEYCSWVTHWMPLPKPPKMDGGDE